MTLVLPQENRARFSRDLDESISSSSTAVANSNSSDSEDQEKKCEDNIAGLHEQYHTLALLEPTKPTVFEQFLEVARLAKTRARSYKQERHQPYKAVSRKGKFAHDYVEPLSSWWGKNERIILGPCVSSIHIQETDSPALEVVNGASHNYAGFYEMTVRSEKLHRLCMDRLPITGSVAVPLLADTHEIDIASFLHTDFACAVGTGYAANYLALPALVDRPTLVILDENSHNSMFTGAYLAKADSIRKFVHNNCDSLEKVLEQSVGQFDQVIVAIEGLYSMEGDVPDLRQIHLLKEKYNFILYCDEAHSFFSLGSTGRGVVEYWNEQQRDKSVPWDVIDIRIVTASKAVGGVGGVICGKSRFHDAVKNRTKDLEVLGFERLSCPQMVQNLWVLSQPTRTRRLLHSLASASRFVRSELSRFGVYVYGESDIQILPIYTGPPTIAARLSYMLRKDGLLGIPISHPAVPYWQSRVRLNLSAHHTEDEIDRLIDAIICACQSLRICKESGVARRKFRYVPRTHRFDRENDEADAAFAKISILIDEASLNLGSYTGHSSRLSQRNCKPEIIQRGHDLRARYGFCSGSSRWACGTYPEHLNAESLLADITGTDTAMTYPDSWVGAASTIAALARPVIGYGMHYMLLTEDGTGPVNDAVSIASPKDAPEMLRYRDIVHLLDIVKDKSRTAKTAKVHFTIYLHFHDAASIQELRAILEALLNAQNSRVGLTILIHSPSSIPRARQIADLMDRKNVQLLVLGSFYQTFGLPGGFLAGSHVLINELRYTSRGYMFTTSSYPWLLGMTAALLENLKQME